jgi:hypothetical protein
MRLKYEKGLKTVNLIQVFIKKLLRRKSKILFNRGRVDVFYPFNFFTFVFDRNFSHEYYNKNNKILL